MTAGYITVPHRNVPEPLEFEVVGTPWVWREFLCFVKAGAEGDVSYIPLGNIEGAFEFSAN